MKKPGIFLSGLVVLLIFPYFQLNFYNDLILRILIMAGFAMSLDVLLGYTGLISLGHASWFAIGAYVLGISGTLYGYTNNLWITLGIAILVSSLVALPVALCVLRTRGLFFIMSTLAFAQIIYYIFHDIAMLGGGSDGFPLAARPIPSIGSWVPFNLDDEYTFYYFIVALVAAQVGIIAIILRSPFGRLLIGIRENKERMTSLGYPVTQYQTLAFCSAAALASVSGYAYAMLMYGVNPEFGSWRMSADALIFVIIGGMGKFWGGLVGTFIFISLEEFALQITDSWHLALGILIVGLVLFLPGGVLSVFNRFTRTSSKLYRHE